MLCRLTRWLISRAEDTGKARPRFAERHAARCAGCGEYARFAAALPGRLSEEVRSLLARAPETDLALEGVDAERAPGRGSSSGRRPVFPRPLPLAAAALALAVVTLVLPRIVLRESAHSPADRQAAFSALKSITTAPDELGGALIDAETSLAGERAILEKSILSALDYLQARLNIRVERRNAPKSI